MTRTFRPARPRPRRQAIWRVRILFGMSLLFVPSALAQKIRLEFDEAADFSKFKTFAIRDGKLRSPNPALNSELMKKRVEADIERALTAKALTKANGRADLNLFYILGSRPHTETETYPAGPSGLGTRTARVQNTEGNFILDMRDAATGSLVWHGIATVEKSDPAGVADKVDDMVKKLLAKFPPRK